MATGIEKSEDSGFFDIGCDHRDYCSLCNFKKVPRLSLRGGCPESHIDTQYVLIFDETHDGFSKLIGSSVSEIRFADWKILQTFLNEYIQLSDYLMPRRYSGSRPGWEIFDVEQAAVVAFVEHQPDDFTDYPIGLISLVFFAKASLHTRYKSLDICEQLLSRKSGRYEFKLMRR